MSILIKKSNTKKLKLSRKHIEATKKSHLQARDSTLLKDAGLTLVDYYDKHFNIQFTPADAEEKQKIWGCCKIEKEENKSSSKKKILGVKSALSNAICSTSAVGDHIYGIREINGILGSNSQWNLIPCIHSENVSWKTVLVNGKTKNIVEDLFTPDEINNLSKEKIILNLSSNNSIEIDSDYDRYMKFIKWKNYVESRGARMFYNGRDEFEKNIKKLIKKYLKDIDKNIAKYISYINGNEILLPIRSIQSANF
jgi:hypothetical protein